MAKDPANRFVSAAAMASAARRAGGTGIALRPFESTAATAAVGGHDHAVPGGAGRRHTADRGRPGGTSTIPDRAPGRRRHRYPGRRRRGRRRSGRDDGSGQGRDGRAAGEHLDEVSAAQPLGRNRQDALDRRFVVRPLDDAGRPSEPVTRSEHRTDVIADPQRASDDGPTDDGTTDR